MSDFDRCVTFTLGMEGGFTDNPADPGNWTSGICGEGLLRGTNFGISAASYPDIDIRNMTPVIAEGIYERDYWRKVYADYLPSGVNLMLFDDAVNAGVTGAIKRFQTVLGVPADGIMGGETCNAAKTPTPTALIAEMKESQMVHLLSLPTFVDFGKGWLKRVDARTALAMQMANGL